MKKEKKENKVEGLKGLLGNDNNAHHTKNYNRPQNNYNNGNSYYSNNNNRRQYNNDNNGNNYYQKKRNNNIELSKPMFVNSVKKEINNDEKLQSGDQKWKKYEYSSNNYYSRDNNSKKELETKPQFKGIGNLLKNTTEENQKIVVPKKNYTDAHIKNEYVTDKDQQQQKEEISEENKPQFTNSQKNEDGANFVEINTKGDLFLEKFQKFSMNQSYPDDKPKEEQRHYHKKNYEEGEDNRRRYNNNYYGVKKSHYYGNQDYDNIDQQYDNRNNYYHNDTKPKKIITKKKEESKPSAMMGPVIIDTGVQKGAKGLKDLFD